MPIRIFSLSELEKLPFVLLTDAWQIEKCADYEMETPDGRRYGLFYQGGEALLHFLKAKGVLVTKKDRRILKNVAGMIVEMGSEEPPQIYGDFDSLVRAWISMHALYGVPVSWEEHGILIDNCSAEYDKLFSDPLLKLKGNEDIAREE